MAQRVLVKQLERYDLKVFATSNGQEAVQGKFLLHLLCFLLTLTSQSGRRMNLASSVLRCSTIVRGFSFVVMQTPNSLSNADMPICDGIEACKRIRVLESKRKASVVLPSECSDFKG